MIDPAALSAFEQLLDRELRDAERAARENDERMASAARGEPFWGAGKEPVDPSQIAGLGPFIPGEKPAHHCALEFTGPRHSPLAESWWQALAPLVIRHPNGHSRVVLRINDGSPPSLYVGLDETTCTRDGHVMRDFAISTVALTYFPGEARARQWFAAAFSGYLMHEALELVTLGGKAVLDPHEEPYNTNPVNRCLRDAFPVELTPATLARTLALVMPTEHARLDAAIARLESWVGDVSLESWFPDVECAIADLVAAWRQRGTP
jgi:hypothetical protein